VVSILGISAFYHDSSASLLRDGEIVAAAQEERFTRKKHDAAYPRHAVDYCVKEAGLDFNDIDHIVFFEKPFLKFERLLETYLAFAPKGIVSFSRAIPVWLREKLFEKDMLIREFRKHDPAFRDDGRLKFSEHHFSHAASAFYPSPFEEAVVLTLDGVGELATATVSIGRGDELTIVKEILFPHSLGLLYSAFTYFTGFKVNSGEYKVMGLAPYGEPKYKKLILDNIVTVKEDGSFWLDQSYFNYCTGLTMTNNKFADLFKAKVRRPDKEPLTQFHMDMARSVQEVTEEIELKITRNLRREYGIPNLCLAGGVALNCVANGKILRDGAFERLWAQPAAGDAGGSLGAALALWHNELKQPRRVTPGKDSMRGAYLGPEFAQEQIQMRLSGAGAKFRVLEEGEVIDFTAKALAEEKAVGWFAGRMEFGPRALGSRSILADPRSPKMQKILNLKVKYRESFRPFAPSVLGEHANEWFELDGDSPYMLLVADVIESRRRQVSAKDQALFGIDKLNVVRSEIPAVTHVDYSARIQTVHTDTNPRYHALISRFFKLTGCPIVVNTSFNIRGEPIVCTPEDAFRCFMGTQIEVLVVGRCVLEKHDQDIVLKEENYENKYELD
jgi:carbamoyltransferase